MQKHKTVSKIILNNVYNIDYKVQDYSWSTGEAWRNISRW